MTKAIWNNQVIAKAPDSEIERVEGNAYFPLSAVRREFLRPSDNHTFCFWKGKASYYDVVVDGRINTDAAWYYAEPFPAAKQIKDHVTFWHGVEVQS